MGKSKEVIIEFAKELYLTPNEQGGHKYSLQMICDEIKRKLNVSYTKATILNWARKEGWDKLWQEGVRQGITKAIAKEESDKTKEEQFREKIAEAKREDFIIAYNLKALGYKYIQEHGFNSVMEALKAIDTGMKYTQELPEPVENIGIQIVVSSEKAKELTEKILKG